MTLYYNGLTDSQKTKVQHLVGNTKTLGSFMIYGLMIDLYTMEVSPSQKETLWSSFDREVRQNLYHEGDPNYSYMMTELMENYLQIKVKMWFMETYEKVHMKLTEGQEDILLYDDPHEARFSLMMTLLDHFGDFNDMVNE